MFVEFIELLLGYTSINFSIYAYELHNSWSNLIQVCWKKAHSLWKKEKRKKQLSTLYLLPLFVISLDWIDYSATSNLPVTVA